MNTTTLNMTTLDGGNVIIKKGEGGSTPPSGESGGHEWQYYDVRNTTLPEGQWAVMMTMLPTLVAIADDADSATSIISGAGIFALYGIEEAKKRLKYIAIDTDVKQYSSMTGNQLISLKENAAQFGQSMAEQLATLGITPITKEEFYTLD